MKILEIRTVDLSDNLGDQGGLQNSLLTQPLSLSSLWLSYYLVLRSKEESLQEVYISIAFLSKAKHLVHTFLEGSLSSPMHTPVQPLVRFSFSSFTVFLL